MLWRGKAARLLCITRRVVLDSGWASTSASAAPRVVETNLIVRSPPSLSKPACSICFTGRYCQRAENGFTPLPSVSQNEQQLSAELTDVFEKHRAAYDTLG